MITSVYTSQPHPHAAHETYYQATKGGEPMNQCLLGHLFANILLQVNNLRFQTYWKIFIKKKEPLLFLLMSHSLLLSLSWPLTSHLVSDFLCVSLVFLCLCLTSPPCPPSYFIAPADLELTMKPRLVINFWSSYLQAPKCWNLLECANKDKIISQ